MRLVSDRYLIRLFHFFHDIRCFDFVNSPFIMAKAA